jgi:Fur family peroxide stress response transcriptional regulator
MDTSTKLASFERACREQGLPITAQRRLVLEILAARLDHPTADVIYQEAIRRMPDLSRTTIYRVLDTLVRIGVVREVHPGTAVRYESRTERHHHLICLSCDRVIDLTDPALDRIPLPDRRRSGFVVEDYSVHFRGLCSDCASNGTPEPRFSSDTGPRTRRNTKKGST